MRNLLSMKDVLSAKNLLSMRNVLSMKDLHAINFNEGFIFNDFNPIISWAKNSLQVNPFLLCI